MPAASGYSLFTKAVMSAISVVKADHVQGGACTKRDTEVFLWLILAPLKSIVARVYLKKNLCILGFRIRTSARSFLRKIYRNISHMGNQCVPGLSSGGRDLGTRLL